jgi:hypothetical protein
VNSVLIDFGISSASSFSCVSLGAAHISHSATRLMLTAERVRLKLLWEAWEA